METQDTPGLGRFPSEAWTFHVRRSDGWWLAHPEDGRAEGIRDAPEWTRRIPTSRAFETEREARDAARERGIDVNDYAVIPRPRGAREAMVRDGHEG